jgi:biopolymer transport protein ExbD
MLQKFVATFGVLIMCASVACAATLEGTIKKVDSDKSTLVITNKDKKDVTVTVNKDAKITLDGKMAMLADLKAGQQAKVTHEEEKASEVEATSAKEK